VLRDMFQNHLLQLLTLVAMEPPASFNASDLRNEKVKVLSAIQPMTPEQVAASTVRAQYKGYRNEEQVNPNSDTPTYAALRLFINNWRWKGVPFYLRSGKHLAEKLSQIIIQFKEPPLAMFPMQTMKPNILVLYLQPDEGLHIRFEAKAPDTVAETRSVDMEFKYSDAFGKTAIPESYERLLLDALRPARPRWTPLAQRGSQYDVGKLKQNAAFTLKVNAAPFDLTFSTPKPTLTRSFPWFQ